MAGDIPTPIGPDQALNSNKVATETHEEKTDGKGISTTPNADNFSESQSEEDDSYPTLEEAELEIANLLSPKKKNRDIVNSAIRTNDLNFSAFNSMFRSKSKAVRSVTKMPAWFTRNLNTASLLKIQDFQRSVQSKYMRKNLSLAYRRTYLLKGISKSLLNIGDILSRKSDAIKVNTGISATVDSTNTDVKAPESFVTKSIKDAGRRVVGELLQGKSLKDIVISRQNDVFSKIDTAKDFIPEGKFKSVSSLLDKVKGLVNKIPVSHKLLRENSFLQNSIVTAADLAKTFAPKWFRDTFGLFGDKDKNDIFGTKGGHKEFLISWKEQQLSVLDSIRKALNGSPVSPPPSDRTSGISPNKDIKSNPFTANDNDDLDEKVREAKHKAVLDSLKKPYTGLKDYYSDLKNLDRNTVADASNDNDQMAGEQKDASTSVFNPVVSNDNIPSPIESVRDRVKESESSLTASIQAAKAAITPERTSASKPAKPRSVFEPLFTQSYKAPNLPSTIQEYTRPTIVRIVSDKPYITYDRPKSTPFKEIKDKNPESKSEEPKQASKLSEYLKAALSGIKGFDIKDHLSAHYSGIGKTISELFHSRDRDILGSLKSLVSKAPAILGAIPFIDKIKTENKSKVNSATDSQPIQSPQSATQIFNNLITDNPVWNTITKSFYKIFRSENKAEPNETKFTENSSSKNSNKSFADKFKIAKKGLFKRNNFVENESKPHADNKQTTTSDDNLNDKEAKVDKRKAFDFLEEERRRKSMESKGDGEEGSFLGDMAKDIGEDILEGMGGKTRLGRKLKLFVGKGKRRIKNLFKGKATKDAVESASKKGLFKRGLSFLGRSKTALGSLFKKKATLGAASALGAATELTGGRTLGRTLLDILKSPFTGTSTIGKAVSELAGGRSLRSAGKRVLEATPSVLGRIISSPFRWGARGLELAAEMGGKGLAKEIAGKSVASHLGTGLFKGVTGAARMGVSVPLYLARLGAKGAWGGTKALFTKPIAGRSVAGHLAKLGWEGTKLGTRATWGVSKASAGMLGRGLWGASKLGAKGLLGAGALTAYGLGKGAIGLAKAPLHTLTRGLRGGVGGFLKGGLGGIAAGLAIDHAEHVLDRHTQKGSAANILGHTGARAADWALTGATIGSLIPGVGTALGATIGGISGASYELYKNLDGIKAGFSSFFHNAWGKNPKIDANGNLIPDPKSAMGKINLGLNSSANSLQEASANLKLGEGDANKPSDSSSSSTSPMGSSNTTPNGSGDGGISSMGGSGGGGGGGASAPAAPAYSDVAETPAYKEVYKGLPKELQERIDKSTNPAMKFAVWSTAVQFGAKTADSLIGDVYKANTKADDKTLIDGIFQKRATSMGSIAMKDGTAAAAANANQRQMAMDMIDGKGKTDYSSMAGSTGGTSAMSAEQFKVTQAAGGDFSNVQISNNGFKKRGTRNNNPGNISFIGTKYQPGAVMENRPGDGSKPRFAHFASMRDGIAAMRNLLNVYQTKYKLRTIRQIIHKWAPAFENNTGGYISHIEKDTGFGADQDLGPVMDNRTAGAIMKSIATMENGAEGKRVGPMIDAVIASANGSPHIPLTGSNEVTPMQGVSPPPEKGSNGSAPAPLNIGGKSSTPTVSAVPPSSSNTPVVAANKSVSISTTTRNISSPPPANNNVTSSNVTNNHHYSTPKDTVAHAHLSNTAKNTSDMLSVLHSISEQLKTGNSGKANQSPVVQSFTNNTSTTLAGTHQDRLSMDNGRRGYSHVG